MSPTPTTSPADYIGAADCHRAADRADDPVLFGLDPEEVAPFLGRYGLSVIANVGVDHLERLIPTTRICDFLGIVHAERI